MLDRLREMSVNKPRHFGHRHSAETKKKMSDRKIGSTPWNKGKKGTFVHSQETKLKIGQLGRGKKRAPRSKEWCLKISQANAGRRQPPEEAAKRGLAFKGKKHTVETRRKLSATKRGPANPQWKGGVNKINAAIRGSLEYKLWREAVFRRDNWTCVQCGTRKSPINADHIKPFCKYPELRFDVDNGRTLCVPCHKRTETYGVNATAAA